MGKSFSTLFVLAFLTLLLVSSFSCEPDAKTAVEPLKPVKTCQIKEQAPQVPEKEPCVARLEKVVKQACNDKADEKKVEAEDSPDVVARIADYVITKKEFKRMFLSELQPDTGVVIYFKRTEPPVDGETVIKQMLGEKAIMMEARKAGYLETESYMKESVFRFKKRKLVDALMKAQVKGKVEVSEAEIEEILKAEPKWNRKQALAAVKRQKSGRIMNQFYKVIYEKRNATKLSENFPKVVEIHRRLLNESRERNAKTYWIRRTQLNKDLTDEEKNMVLATFDGGKVTLEDWFIALCQYSPPRRPKDLNTVQGVERLLNGNLSTPILLAEAEARGFDEDEKYLGQLRAHEDRVLMNKVRAIKKVEEPNEEVLFNFYLEHKEAFSDPEQIEINEIWCEDHQTAKKVRAELDAGADFEAVQKQYNLFKEKNKPSETNPQNESFFFDQLWAGEPNEIIGPMKGFVHGGVKWRVVKILKKSPVRMREWSEGTKGMADMKYHYETARKIINAYGLELLEKYPHKIYYDRIEAINPLDIP